LVPIANFSQFKFFFFENWVCPIHVMLTLKYSHKILASTIPCSWNNEVRIIGPIATPHWCLWDQICFEFEYHIVIIAVDAIKSDHDFAPVKMSTVQ